MLKVDTTLLQGSDQTGRRRCYVSTFTEGWVSINNFLNSIHLASLEKPPGAGCVNICTYIHIYIYIHICLQARQTFAPGLSYTAQAQLRTRRQHKRFCFPFRQPHDQLWSAARSGGTSFRSPLAYRLYRSWLTGPAGAFGKPDLSGGFRKILAAFASAESRGFPQGHQDWPVFLGLALKMMLACAVSGTLDAFGTLSRFAHGKALVCLFQTIMEVDRRRAFEDSPYCNKVGLSPRVRYPLDAIAYLNPLGEVKGYQQTCIQTDWRPVAKGWPNPEQGCHVF